MAERDLIRFDSKKNRAALRDSTSTIAFLHTADVHVATFDRLLGDRAPGIKLKHTVRSEWLAEARRAGLTKTLRARVAAFLRRASQRADAVVCTCSTLGPVADFVGADRPHVFRVDRPMMNRAAGHPGTVLVALCLQSTETPTLDLLRDAFAAYSKPENFDVVRCVAAWPLFEAGDRNAFGRAIAATVTAHVEASKPPGCVVLAQASMAAAEPYLATLDMPVYSSPRLAAETALRLLGREAKQDPSR